jgi:peptidoglycan/xylan/chitin deacetylase (PgdA/CDA1 family)
VAAGLAGVAAARGTEGSPLLAPQAAPAERTTSPPRPAAAAKPAEPARPHPVPPPTGVVDELAGEGTSLALTIDDGTSTEVVAAFTTLAAETGVRLTFFPNGRYSSWADNARALQPMVDSGQIALGNHTWSHPDLTTLSDAEVADEIARNRDFLRDTFGVRDSPFFRPPFGARDERIDRIAADVGHPTVVMWNGTLDDARPVTGADLVAAAEQWFAARAIIVGHANQPAVTTVFDEILAVVEQRRLSTVTLADVWATADQRVRGATATGVSRLG